MTSAGPDVRAESGSLVSAVIIFLNAGRFLGESIESVLSQTYSDIELLLVDDGSDDGSVAIARRYAEAFPDRVRLLQHPGGVNRGMSASRNLGAMSARGQWIAFLDSDDVWLPEKTEQQVAIFREHPGIGMVYGRTQIWHSWGDASAKDHFYALGVAANTVHDQPTLLATLLENRFQSPTTCNAMISRVAFDQLGGFEDRFRGMYEDQVFFAKLYLKFPTYVSDRYWARYRQHDGNSGNHFSQSTYYRERAGLMDFVHGYAKSFWPQLDDSTRISIRRERWRARHPVLATWAMRLKARLKRLGLG